MQRTETVEARGSKIPNISQNLTAPKGVLKSTVLVDRSQMWIRERGNIAHIIYRVTHMGMEKFLLTTL